MENNVPKITSLDDLAAMVAEGFSDIGGRMDRLEGRMDRLEGEVAALRSSVNNYLKLSDKRYLELKARQDLIVSWIEKIAKKTNVEIDVKELEKLS